MPEESSTAVPGLPLPKDLRKGQKAVCELFIAGQRKVVAKLPTGYGKTRVIATAFAIDHHPSNDGPRSDYLLVIVPSVEQAFQAEAELPALVETLGVETKAFIVGNNRGQLMRTFRQGGIKILIATVQSLFADRTLQFLMEYLHDERVMLAIDEFHHYGIDTAWSRKVLGIPWSALIALSATPDRKGEEPLFGRPDVSLSYLEALEENVVKPLVCHAYDYKIDYVRKETGEIETFSISDLIREAGDSDPQSIERWQAARKGRYSSKYISPLLRFPIERLVDFRASTGRRGQMIVCALTCAHAEAVCEQVRSMVPQEMSVDWVGTGPDGRTDADNIAIMNRFCPAKDRHGVRRWSLDVLVTVGKAGEGLDVTDAIEIVFLNSPSINNRTKQAIGRLSRRMGRKGDKVWQAVGHVNVDMASPWAEHPESIMGLMDQDNGDVPEPDPDVEERRQADEEYQPITDAPLSNFIDIELTNIRDDPMFLFIREETASGLRRALPQGPEAEAYAADLADKAALEAIRKRDDRFSGTLQLVELRGQINARTRKVAGLAMRKAMPDDVRPPREMLGDLCKRLNREKKQACGCGVDEATADELQRHNQWLVNLQATLLSGGFPSWLK